LISGCEDAGVQQCKNAVRLHEAHFGKELAGLLGDFEVRIFDRRAGARVHDDGAVSADIFGSFAVSGQGVRKDSQVHGA
jgi:hypothetical protein